MNAGKIQKRWSLLSALVLLAGVFAQGCGPTTLGASDYDSDSDLFGAKADGVDLEAIRSLEFGSFTVDEVLTAIKEDPELRSSLRDNGESLDNVIEALMNLEDPEGFDIRGYFFGNGWQWGFLFFGGESRGIQMKFKTPKGSIAAQAVELEASTLGPQLGAEFSLVVGLIVQPQGQITLRDLDNATFTGVSATSLVSKLPVTVGMDLLLGDSAPFSILMASVGLGVMGSLTYNSATMTIRDDLLPRLLEYPAVPGAISMASEAVVSGVLVSRTNNIGAPGLIVSLVHPQLGRSVPAISDTYGRYMFYGIPVMPTPYYIEVYWGNQIIYRNTILIDVPTVEIPSIMF